MTDRKSPVEQALDLFFYAPLGLLLNAEEVIPELVEKGRQQAAVARMFGQFAVKQGQTEAAKVVAKVQHQFVGGDEHKPAPAPDVPTSPAPDATATPPPDTNGSSVNGAVRVAADAPAPSTLAIPDYDSLSASQVVPRLEGLAATELDAVRAYEEAHRGRKTILSKIDQLQG